MRLCLTALVLASLVAGCRKPPAPAPPAGAPNTLDDVAKDLVAGLRDEPVTCIAVCEALGPADGGRERSDFGTYVLTPIASLMRQQDPRLRLVKLDDCPKYSEAWMRETALAKADAVLEGSYLPGESTFELTIQVCRPLGRILASSHRVIEGKPSYQAMASRRLPPVRPHAADKAVLKTSEVQSELFHAPATDPAIKITISSVRSPVRLGGAIQFVVESNVNGYLAILYHGSSGKLEFLAPSQLIERVTVRAGEALSLPTTEMAAKGIALEACEPAGWERVKAIVSREAIPWPRDAAGNVPTDSPARLRAIAEVLKDAKFGEARCELETKP